VLDVANNIFIQYMIMTYYCI